MDRKVRPLSSSNTMTWQNSAPPFAARRAPPIGRAKIKSSGALVYEEVVFIVVVVVLFCLFLFFQDAEYIVSSWLKMI